MSSAFQVVSLARSWRCEVRNDNEENDERRNFEVRNDNEENDEKQNSAEFLIYNSLPERKERESGRGGGTEKERGKRWGFHPFLEIL